MFILQHFLAEKFGDRLSNSRNKKAALHVMNVLLSFMVNELRYPICLLLLYYRFHKAL